MMMVTYKIWFTVLFHSDKYFPHQTADNQKLQNSDIFHFLHSLLLRQASSRNSNASVPRGGAKTRRGLRHVSFASIVNIVRSSSILLGLPSTASCRSQWSGGQHVSLRRKKIGPALQTILCFEEDHRDPQHGLHTYCNVHVYSAFYPSWDGKMRISFMAE